MVMVENPIPLSFANLLRNVQHLESYTFENFHKYNIKMNWKDIYTESDQKVEREILADTENLWRIS